MQSRPVQIRFFSVLRERAGTGNAEIAIETACSSGDIEQRVIALFPAIEPYAPSWRIAVNRQYVDRNAQVNPGDEVAFITPVSGG